MARQNRQCIKRCIFIPVKTLHKQIVLDAFVTQTLGHLYLFIFRCDQLRKLLRFVALNLPACAAPARTAGNTADLPLSCA